MKAAVSARRRIIQLAKYCQAIVRHHGQLTGVVDDLGLEPGQVRRLTYTLRHTGALRLVNVVDPVKLGRSVQRVTWLSIDTLSPDEVARFEQELIDDPAVTSAQAVSGDADYRIATFHADVDEALAWYHALRHRPGVVSFRHTSVDHRFGHDLSGIVVAPARLGPPALPRDTAAHAAGAQEHERSARSAVVLHRRILAMAKARNLKL